MTKIALTPRKFIGASTDTKPTGAEVPIGSTFFEYDTHCMYITYDSTNWVFKELSLVLKEVAVEKAIAAAGNYAAEDVISESASAGTAWTFAGLGRANGAYGYITKAKIEWETTALTPRLTLYLFNAAPTTELDDNKANAAPAWADRTQYVGKIDFPALEDLGGVSEAVVTPSTTGNLPLAFKCASDADDLIGILVTRDAITGEAAGESIRITLTVEQL